MKDILGREIHVNDLVVAKGTGRYNCGLRVGLMREKSVRFLNGISAGYTELFKITNPTKEELEVKQKILKHEKEKEDEKIQTEKTRKSKKAIPKKDLEIGRLYVDDKGSKMYFLGKGKATEYTDEWNNRWTKTKSKGDNFIVVKIDSHFEKYYGLELCYEHIERCKTLGRKTVPRFVEKLDKKMDIKDNMIELIENKEKPQNRCGFLGVRTRKKVIIELENK